MAEHSLAAAAIRIAAVTAIVLLVPLVAMQFTSEVVWDGADFLAAGGLLFGAGMTYAVAARRARRPLHRAAIAAVVLVVLATVWAELAVGLFS